MNNIIQEILNSVPPEEIKYDDILYMVIEEFHSFMEKNNITQKCLAQKLNVSPACVSKMLSGDTNLTIKSIAKLATALNVDIQFAITEKHKQRFYHYGRECNWTATILPSQNGYDYAAFAA